MTDNEKNTLANSFFEKYKWIRCDDNAQLLKWLSAYLDLSIPTHAVCPGHCAPMQYLSRAYFDLDRDLIVHGPRSGGKTRIGALVTLLDALHKPGIQIRILGGSFEQSFKMWEYLAADCEKLGVGKIRNRRIQLSNGSSVGVLAQSQRAVRGLHVQKIRCDEVDMFDRDVWAAAQLATNSRGAVKGTVEALSTMHKPYGIMSELIERAAEKRTPVLRWCILEVLEHCSDDRLCATCPLEEDCHGIAKEKCNGFFSIDDAIAVKQRVSLDMWQSEMLCRRPGRSDTVFPSFDMDVHVKQCEGTADWLALDFGYANPFVCLWICDEGGLVKVIDEYVMSGKIVDQHVEELRLRWGDVKRVACDPAGNGRNEQTGESTIAVLKRNGYVVKSRKSGIMEGVEKIRAALCAGDRRVSITIHPRCVRLIKAMRCYQLEPGKEVPFKDGVHDHAVDALRYFFLNREGTIASARRY
jgi:hypothetical protein